MNKRIGLLAISLLIGLLIVVACAGPAGPQGPAGPPGPQGEIGPVGPSGDMALMEPSEPYVHGILVDIDGEDYYFDGPADGPDSAKDIPGHYWVQFDSMNLQGLHYNTGPDGAAQWWSSDAEDGTLLYVVGAIIDTWTPKKAEEYAAMGYIHYHEMVKVSDGSFHPNKVVWLRHHAVTDFTLDGGPHPELEHMVAKGLDTEFVPNYTIPYMEDSGKYEVKITNLTRGQIMSPVVVISHDFIKDPLFVLGSPASDELALVAEDAMNDELIAAFESDERTKDVQTITGENGPILPGETASSILTAGDYISAVSMLVTTNDAFFALNGIYGPENGSVIYLAPAYDAGSEANNENGDFIPGPPFGNAEIRATENAEGYVHIHAGIHGIADLDPDMYDWHNPVAKIEITRM